MATNTKDQPRQTLEQRRAQDAWTKAADGIARHQPDAGDRDERDEDNRDQDPPAADPREAGHVHPPTGRAPGGPGRSARRSPA